MSKKSCKFPSGKSLYINGQDFLDMQNFFQAENIFDAYSLLMGGEGGGVGRGQGDFKKDRKRGTFKVCFFVRQEQKCFFFVAEKNVKE